MTPDEWLHGTFAHAPQRSDVRVHLLRKARFELDIVRATEERPYRVAWMTWQTKGHTRSVPVYRFPDGREFVGQPVVHP